MKIVKTSLVILLCLIVQQLVAQQISVSEAQQRAMNFFKSDSHRAAQRGAINNLPILAYTSKQEGVVSYYVFNDASDDGGFVIVGGDETATAILGYCDHGTFDYETAPENFKWWLSQYDEQIRMSIEAVKLGGVAAKTTLLDNQRRGAERAAAASRSTIEPLVKAKWDQDAPYNNAIPKLPEGNSPFVTGCVATALAQVLHYYKYPVKGIGNHSFQANYNIGQAELCPITFSADFGNTTYDWDNMLNSYSGSYTSAQVDAMATLIYHCGVAVDMSYGQVVSGAVSERMLTALFNYFGYDQTARLRCRLAYTDSEWEDIVYAELAEGRPVLYSGQSAKGSGHQFVCDGYSASGNTAGLFAFNWGWGSYCDGHFALTGSSALCPKGSGTGGGGTGSAYTGDQLILVGMSHAGSKAAERARMSQVRVAETGSNFYLKAGSDKLVNYEMTAGSSQSLYLYTTMRNSCGTYSDFTIGIKAIDTVTGVYAYKNCTSVRDLNPGHYYTTPQPISFSFAGLTRNGVYELHPVCRPTGSTSDDDWEEFEIDINEPMPTLTIVGGEATTKRTIPFDISDSEVEAGRTIQITHAASYNGKTTYTSSNTALATVDADGVVTGVAAGTVKITVKGAETEIYKATTKTFEIEVLSTVRQDIDVTISATQLNVDGTAKITVGEGYDGTVSFVVADPSIASVTDKGEITALAPGQTTVRVSAPATKLFNAIDKSFGLTVILPLEFYEPPYFHHDNNPYADDFVLYLPIINNNDRYVLATIAVSNRVGNAIVTRGFTVGASAHETQIRKIDYSNYLSYAVIDAKSECYFYLDSEKTTSFNIPTITYTFRDKLSHTCTLNHAGLGTLILPFNASIPEGWVVYGCTDGNGYLQLVKANSIERNKPYIIIGPADATAEFKGPNAIDKNDYTFADGLLVGALASDQVAYSKGDYVTSTSAKSITKASTSKKADAFTAFLRLGSDFHGLTQPTTIKVTDVVDVPTLVQCLSCQKPAAVSFVLADVNGDGVVSVADLTTLISEQ